MYYQRGGGIEMVGGCSKQTSHERQDPEKKAKSLNAEINNGRPFSQILA